MNEDVIESSVIKTSGSILQKMLRTVLPILLRIMINVALV